MIKRYQRPSYEAPGPYATFGKLAPGCRAIPPTDQDPGWARPALRPLYEKAEVYLLSAGQLAGQATARNWDELRPEVVAAKKRELVGDHREKMLAGLAKSVQEVRDEATAAERSLGRAALPEPAQDVVTALRNELRAAEVRRWLEEVPGKVAAAEIKRALDDGNPALLQAAVDSPRPLSIPGLADLAKEHVAATRPDLVELVQDRAKIAELAARRAGELLSLGGELLAQGGLDDVLTREEIAAAIQPDNPHAQAWARQADRGGPVATTPPPNSPAAKLQAAHQAPPEAA